MESDLVQISCPEKRQMKYGIKCITFAQNMVSPAWLCSLSPRCTTSCLAFYEEVIGMPVSPLLWVGLGTAGQLKGRLSSSEGVGRCFRVGLRIYGHKNKKKLVLAS